MAITAIIEDETAAVSGAATEFTTTSRGFWLTGDYFAPGESALVERVGPSGDYQPATNKDGQIYLSANPNTIFCDLPAGTYRINKTVTALPASVGYEEEA
jgi:hypothetical protein